jgi:drug/metabolite transporter (DMT)-like permease
VVVFTAVFATAAAFLVQTWAQSIMDPSRVAIILTTEVIFAAAIAVAVGQETLALRTVIGGALMVVAMLIVEWPDRKSKTAKAKARFT